MPQKDKLKKRLKPIFILQLLFIGLIAFNSCEEETKKRLPKTKMDFSENVPFKFERFDKEWFDLPTMEETEKIDFYNKNKDFINVVSRNLLNIKITDSLEILDAFEQLAKEQQLLFVYDTTLQLIGDLSSVQAEFQTAMNYYAHYFPNQAIPTIKTLITEFGIGSFTIGSDIIGLGLDMYLGEDFPAYAAVGVPKYIQKRMDKNDIVPVSMQVLLDELSPPFKGSTMMDEMIYKGKKMYVLERLLPETADTLLWGFTQNQLDWCFENESAIWTFLASEELLYSSERRNFQKYLNPAPSSPGMPETSPGRTGVFIGYKMAHAYMKQFPDTKMEDLLQANDYTDFLEKARYKPAR